MENKRERGTGRLFQRGQVWWAQYYLHGQQVRISTGEADEKKAGKFLKRRLAEVETGTHGDTGTVRYEQLRDSYMADFEVNNRKSLRRNADGDVYVDCVVRLDAFFSGYKASEIDADSIRKFQAEQRSKGLSNGSINRSVSALRRMFNIAKREERLRDVPYFPFLKESAPRAGFVERAGYEQLLAALPDDLRPVLALGFWTGMRRAEVSSGFNGAKSTSFRGRSCCAPAKPKTTTAGPFQLQHRCALYCSNSAASARAALPMSASAWIGAVSPAGWEISGRSGNPAA